LYFAGYLVIEAATAATKEAAPCGDLTSGRTLDSDVHTYLHHAVFSSWQDERIHTQDNKLQAVMAAVEVWQSSFNSIMKEEVLLMCLWIGHTCLTHGHLL
jgi:hypothetical protein